MLDRQEIIALTGITYNVGFGVKQGVSKRLTIRGFLNPSIAYYPIIG